MAGFVDWVVGQVLSAADLMKLPQHNYVRKGSDTARQNTTTRTADPHLTLAVSSNTDYILDGLIQYSATNGVGIGFSWIVPSGATLEYHSGTADLFDSVSTPYMSIGTYTDSFPLSAVGFSSGGTSNSFKLAIRPHGILRVGGTSGSLTFSWAQNSTDPEHTVVRAGSFIRLTRLN